MPRPPKSQAREDTRGEIVEAAWELFSREGYDATPINAIIEKVGLSKGAFYYYFRGKEDLLDAVVTRIIGEIALAVESIPSDASLAPLDKLRAFMESIGNWKVAHMNIITEATAVLYRAENAIIRHKMNEYTVRMLAPVLTRVLAQGVEAGEFDLEWPEEMAEIILRFFNAMAEMQAEAFLAAGENSNLELVMRMAGVYMEAVERMLGVGKDAVFDMEGGMKEKLELALGKAAAVEKREIEKNGGAQEPPRRSCRKDGVPAALPGPADTRPVREEARWHDGQ